MIHYQFIRDALQETDSAFKILGLAYADEIIGDNVYLKTIVRDFTNDYTKLKSRRRNDLVDGTLCLFIKNPEINLDLWFAFVSQVIDGLGNKRKTLKLLDDITDAATEMRFKKTISMTNSTIEKIFKVMEFVASKQISMGMPFDIKEWYEFFVGVVDKSQARDLFMRYFGWLKGKEIKSRLIESVLIETGFYFGSFDRHYNRILFYLKDVTNLKSLIDNCNSNLKYLYRTKGIFRALSMLWHIRGDNKQAVGVFLPSANGWLDKDTKFFPKNLQWIPLSLKHDECSNLMKASCLRILAKNGSVAVISLDGQCYMVEKMIKKISGSTYFEIAVQQIEQVTDANAFLANIMI